MGTNTRNGILSFVAIILVSGCMKQDKTPGSAQSENALMRDDDSDGIPSGRDNCYREANPLQEDIDGDGRGDVCDKDEDGDGRDDGDDNCPHMSNDQSDADRDKIGDECDPEYNPQVCECDNPEDGSDPAEPSPTPPAPDGGTTEDTDAGFSGEPDAGEPIGGGGGGSTPVNPNESVLVGNRYRNPESSQMTAGTTVTLAVFEFSTPKNDRAVIDRVTLRQRVTDPDQASFHDYDRLYLADYGDNVVFGEVIPTSTDVTIYLDHGLDVYGNNIGEAFLYVRADLADICGGCAVDVGGHQLGYDFVSATGRWAASGENVDFIHSEESPPVGNTHLMFKGRPYVANTAEFFFLRNGDGVDLTDVGIGAIGDDIDNAEATFEIVTSGASVTRVDLYYIEYGMEELIATQTVSSTSAQVFVSLEFTPIIIPAGSSPYDGRSLRLRGTVVGASSGDLIQARMVGDASPPVLAGRPNYPGTYTEIVSDGARFIWSDRSAMGHSLSSSDWMTGYLVSGLQTSWTFVGGL